jgi:amino acid transporter
MSASPPVPSAATGAEPIVLKRSLTLPLLVLYGLGVTVGAGIYVLIGSTAGRAGALAPLAFMLAAVVMGLSGAAFAELAGRMPLSAGEAAYVRAATRSDRLALFTGALVLVVAIIAAAAIAKGAAGYLSAFVPLPRGVLTAGLILVLGAVAAVGIKEAVGMAAVMTLVEIAGLLAIVVASLIIHPDDMLQIAASAVPASLDRAALVGVIGAFLLSFFAFIGFESLVNLAEETHAPAKIIPRAIFLTLLLSTILYILVVIAALAAVPVRELAASAAPLSLVFERTTGASPLVISAIAVFATVNGVIAQLILASRILYGLAQQGVLPPVLGAVDRRTQTPLIATALSTLAVVLLASTIDLDRLAELTTYVMLVVFALVNAALIIIKRRGDPAPADVFRAPLWVPVCGLTACVSLLAAAALV